jgi:carbamoyl-phosphate synthase large subunit
MRSTGEVLGLADSPGMAFFKAQEAAQEILPFGGTVLITVADDDKKSIVETARQFAAMGFKIAATDGTFKHLAANGVKAERILKMHEGRPHIVDQIKNKEIHLIINTPDGKQSQHDDSYIRKAAIKYKIPYITTATAAAATAKGIAARIKTDSTVKSLQEYHTGIK